MMDRIQELKLINILDTEPEQELDGYIHQLNQEYFSLKSLLNKKWGLS